jgi:hypothetical protein
MSRNTKINNKKKKKLTDISETEEENYYVRTMSNLTAGVYEFLFQNQRAGRDDSIAVRVLDDDDVVGAGVGFHRGERV